MLGRVREVGLDASAAIALAPDDVNVLAGAYLARSVSLADRLLEALAATEAAIALAPTDLNLFAFAYLSRSEALGGRPAEALAEDEAAIALAPRDPTLMARAHFYRGIDLDALGLRVEAAAAFGVAEACVAGECPRASFEAVGISVRS